MKKRKLLKKETPKKEHLHHWVNTVHEDTGEEAQHCIKCGEKRKRMA